MQTETQNISMQELLQEWQKANLISKAESPAIANAGLRYQNPLPLYLRILIGIGALFSVNFFMGFFYAAHIIDFNSTTAQMIWGLIFIGLAILAGSRAKNRNGAVAHSFFIQTSFCAIWLGKLLFVMGFTHMFRQTIAWDQAVTLALLLLTVATYFLYPVSIDRFLSSLATLLFLFMSLIDPVSYSGILPWILNLFFLLQLVLATFLFLHPRVKKVYIPLAYAIICSLASIIIYFSLVSHLYYGVHTLNFNLFFINILLTISLTASMAWVVGDYKTLIKEPLRAIALGIILLGAIAQPGILLGLCFMTVGYARYEKALLLLGMILVPVFLFFYYYNLDLNFLTKSVTLIGSGMLFLAARAYLSLQKLDQEA